MAEYRYTRDHEWVLRDGNRAKIGISSFAQEELGDIAYVELPDVGMQIVKGQTACSIDSLKASSEIFAPVSGTVGEVNERLRKEEDCGIINEDPLGEGWIFSLEMTDSAEWESLMKEDEYNRYTDSL